MEFLQWCLPQLHLRWEGFRKVRRHIYKRVRHRLQELALPNLRAYQAHLQDHPEEWSHLSSLCWVCISRFYRDRSVFQYLQSEVLPELARIAIDNRDRHLRCWSAGCASGEEPHTLAIIWKHSLALRYPQLDIRTVATDIDPEVIRRAVRGCYPYSSVNELPVDWRIQAFIRADQQFCLREEYHTHTTFLVQDIRTIMPKGDFHLILCRNLVFTYFDEVSQQEILEQMTGKLVTGGALAIGKLETLPGPHRRIEPWSQHLGIYRKVSPA